MVAMVGARARRLPPRVALILEAFAWFIPPALLYGLNLYAGTPGIVRVLLICAGAIVVFVPWTARERFQSSSGDKGGRGIRDARLWGRILFGLMQILWIGLLLPLSSPLWLWALVLIIAFVLVPPLAGPRGVNIAPGALVFAGVTAALFLGAAPGVKSGSACVWKSVTGTAVCGGLDGMPGIALFAILIPVLLRPGRRLTGVVLFLVFGAAAAFFSGALKAGPSMDPAVIISGLAFAGILVFAPGRPVKSPGGWLFYYVIAALFLAIILLIPSFASKGSFPRALLLSILAAELIPPLLSFPVRKATRRDS